MEDIRYEKRMYSVSGICCSSCGPKIENGLNRLNNVKNVKVDVINNILHVEASSFDNIESTVKKIDGHISLNAQEDTKEEEKKISFIPISLLFVVYALLLVVLHLDAAPQYAVYSIFALLYLIAGKNLLLRTYKSARQLSFFNENSLMLIATVAAVSIGYYEEAVAVMLFVRLGEILENYAVDKSKKSISKLFTDAPLNANLLVDDSYRQVLARDLKIDQIVLIRAGESVPIDCILVQGSGNINLAVINGEGEPRFVKEGDFLNQGAIVLDSALVCRVVANYSDSSISTIRRLVEEANLRKADTDKFITTFAKYYTPTVLALCLLIVSVFPFIFGGDVKEWIYRALVVLMVSCPCALVISIPLSYFSALGMASRRGILIKGANYLDALRNLRFIAFDKTGTLTNGNFILREIKVLDDSYDERSVLSIAKSMQLHSIHPIAKAFHDVDADMVDVSRVREIKANGLKASIGDKEALLGSGKFLSLNGIQIKNTQNVFSEVYLALDSRVVAVFLLNDELKSDTINAVENIKRLGVKNIHILSGDNPDRTSLVASTLNCDFDASLSPSDKERLFSKLMMEVKDKDKDAKCAFVGDGINDSIVLSLADIGFSIGTGSSDLSKQSSDIVLINDSVDQIAQAILISKKTKTIVMQNIVLALGVKIAFIALGLGGFATLWEAIFGDMGVSLLALLNTSRIYKI